MRIEFSGPRALGPALRAGSITGQPETCSNRLSFRLISRVFLRVEVRSTRLFQTIRDSYTCLGGTTTVECRSVGAQERLRLDSLCRAGIVSSALLPGGDGGTGEERSSGEKQRLSFNGLGLRTGELGRLAAARPSSRYCAPCSSRFAAATRSMAKARSFSKLMFKPFSCGG